MYGLTEDDLDIQKRARAFADEVIPCEEQAELAGGELPADLAADHAMRARELGLCATNMQRFVTMIMVVLDPVQHRATIVNAGHMAPLVRRTSAQIEEPSETIAGLPLGVTAARADLMTWPPGTHASTFGGNPVSCAAALATLADSPWILVILFAWGAAEALVLPVVPDVLIGILAMAAPERAPVLLAAAILGGVLGALIPVLTLFFRQPKARPAPAPTTPSASRLTT